MRAVDILLRRVVKSLGDIVALRHFLHWFWVCLVPYASPHPKGCTSGAALRRAPHDRDDRL